MGDEGSSMNTEVSVKRPTSEKSPMSISLKLKPVGEVKEAVALLCHPNLNPQGMAMIEVGRGNNKFRLSVCNKITETVAFLDINATCASLISFSCTQPLENMFVNLYHILSRFQSRPFLYDDTIKFIHVHGTNQLSFAYGDDSKLMSKVELSKTIPDAFERPPDTIFYCGVANLWTKDLRKIIPYMLNEKGQSRATRLEISDKLVNISIGTRKWDLEYAKPEEFSGISEGQKHCVWLHWPHIDLLKKLCDSAKRFYFSVVTDPPKSIVFQFGRLVFLHKADGIFINYETLSY